MKITESSSQIRIESSNNLSAVLAGTLSFLALIMLSPFTALFMPFPPDSGLAIALYIVISAGASCHFFKRSILTISHEEILLSVHYFLKKPSFLQYKAKVREVTFSSNSVYTVLNELNSVSTPRYPTLDILFNDQKTLSLYLFGGMSFKTRFIQLGELRTLGDKVAKFLDVPFSEHLS